MPQEELTRPEPTPSSAPDRPARRKSGVVIAHQARWHQRLLARGVWLVLRTLATTLRYHLHDPNGLISGGSPQRLIFCIWHNRLSLSVIIYQKYVQRPHPERHMAAMASASRDGALLARIIELFGVQPARGSSSRRGPQALRELHTWAERGYDLAITPDGPRGPCYVVQEGAAALGQLTGLPVVPISYHLGWKIRFRSWDRFQLPLPFGRCDVQVGESVLFPKHATDAEREGLRQQLEARMRALTKD